MGKSGTECEQCDNNIIVFSREKDGDDEGTVIIVDCQECWTQYELKLSDLVEDIPKFCCGFELLPNEYDEEMNDFLLEVACAMCGGGNTVSVDTGLHFLAIDEYENRIEIN